MHCHFLPTPPPTNSPPQKKEGEEERKNLGDIIKGQPLMYSNLYSHVVLPIFLHLLFLLNPPPPPHVRIFNDNYDVTGW